MFLKNKNIIFKIRRSKVTDYAALRVQNVVNTSDCKQTNENVIFFSYESMFPTLTQQII